MPQKESKKMAKMKYFKKFPELKKDERHELKSAQREPQERPTLRNSTVILKNIKFKSSKERVDYLKIKQGSTYYIFQQLL